MDVGQYIKKLRVERNLTQEELGELTGVNRAAVQKWECGKVQNLKRETIKKLSEIFNVSPATFVDTEFVDEKVSDLSQYGIRPIRKKKFRMLGEIACGQPIYCNEDYETYVEASADIDADFCLTARGDSMINARIFDGDIVFIREQPDVEDGEIAAVIIEDEITLKRVYKNHDTLELRAENPRIKPFVYRGEELNHIRILGKAIAFQSDII